MGMRVPPLAILWKRGARFAARVVFAMLVLIALASIALFPRTARFTRALAIRDMGPRILIVAPHPDDEVLTSGGVIQQALATGAEVRVVIVTAGDGYYAAARRVRKGRVDPASYVALGEVRHVESLRAARRLGLPAADLISLGFPDTGITDLWTNAWTEADLSAARTRVDRVPYAWALRPGAPYTGQELSDELISVIEDFRPYTVIAPDPHETHPDHSGVAAFAMLALDHAGFTGRRLTTIVHYTDYPYPWSIFEKGKIEPPPGLSRPGSSWLSLELTDRQIAVKRQALASYRSQERITSDRLGLPEFARRNELFDDRAPAAVTPAGSTGASSATTVVDVTPAMPLGLVIDRATWISDVSVTKRRDRLEVVLTCAGRPSRAVDYGVSLHVVREATETARIDVGVSRGAVATATLNGAVIGAAPVVATLSGRTVVVSLPASLLEGSSHAILGASATRRGVWRFHTAWRDIVLVRSL